MMAATSSACSWEIVKVFSIVYKGQIKIPAKAKDYVEIILDCIED